jgi:hypothetical protein
MKHNKHPSLASIPESYDIYNANGRSSDLLPVFLPSHLNILNSGGDLDTVMKLTAAGQLRNYTVFPFNPDIFEISGTKSNANVSNL